MALEDPSPMKLATNLLQKMYPTQHCTERQALEVARMSLAHVLWSVARYDGSPNFSPKPSAVATVPAAPSSKNPFESASASASADAAVAPATVCVAAGVPPVAGIAAPLCLAPVQESVAAAFDVASGVPDAVVADVPQTTVAVPLEDAVAVASDHPGSPDRYQGASSVHHQWLRHAWSLECHISALQQVRTT